MSEFLATRYPVRHDVPSEWQDLLAKLDKKSNDKSK